MRNIFYIISLILITVNFSCKETSAQQANLLEPQEMKAFLASNDVLLIDVRTPKEYKSGHIEKAINVDFKSPDFAEVITKLDTTQTLVIYCRSGRRSKMSASLFLDFGFDEVYDLKGGVLNWQKNGLNLVK